IDEPEVKLLALDLVHDEFERPDLDAECEIGVLGRVAGEGVTDQVDDERVCSDFQPFPGPEAMGKQMYEVFESVDQYLRLLVSEDPSLGRRCQHSSLPRKEARV